MLCFIYLLILFKTFKHVHGMVLFGLGDEKDVFWGLLYELSILSMRDKC